MVRKNNTMTEEEYFKYLDSTPIINEDDFNPPTDERKLNSIYVDEEDYGKYREDFYAYTCMFE